MKSGFAFFCEVTPPRDGLLKANLDSLGDNESPFMNSVIDYYQARPVELEHITMINGNVKYVQLNSIELMTRGQNLKIDLNKKNFQTLSLASLSMENSIPST